MDFQIFHELFVVHAYMLYIYLHLDWYGASQVALVIKNLPANAGDIGDTGSVSGSGRSPGEGNDNPL